MADWSQLPKDLLQLISEKLNSDFYILRFRSVCSSWRLSIPKPHNHFPLKLPHFFKHEKLYKYNIFLIKGRPCLTDNTGRTVIIGSDLSVHLAAEPGFRGNINGEIYIMVENESELLLVHKYEVYYDSEDDYDDDDEFLRFEVFRLDQREKKWVKLENLGDMVLFLGQGYSFAISASDLGLDNGNSVIYCNYNRNEMRIFPLDIQQTFLLSVYPYYFKLFWPPPEWIVSRCL